MRRFVVPPAAALAILAALFSSTAAEEQFGYAEIAVENATRLAMRVHCGDFIGAPETTAPLPAGSRALCGGVAPVTAKVEVKMAEGGGWGLACETLVHQDWRLSVRVEGRTPLFLRCRRALDVLAHTR